MNQEQTIALWHECEDARAKALAEGKSEDEAHQAATRLWNGWASEMLARKAEMEKTGTWAEEDAFGDLKAKNIDTRCWMDDAAVVFSCLGFSTQAHEDEDKSQLGGRFEVDPASLDALKSLSSGADAARFDGWIFPGTVDFGQVQFHGSAGFEDAQFHGVALFRNAQFRASSRFRKAQFHCNVGFEGAQFHRVVGFQDAQFQGDARFQAAEFHSDAEFSEAQFHRNARFQEVRFYATARFLEAQFHGNAAFQETQFRSRAVFMTTRFRGNAGFGDAHFHGITEFQDARFQNTAEFRQAQFSRIARFENAQFSGPAMFVDSRFSYAARFEGVKFSDTAHFGGTRFSGAARFKEAQFSSVADYQQAQFGGYTSFKNVVFRAEFNLTGIRSEGTFDLADVTFDILPSLIQANFKEPPRFDHLTLKTPLASSEPKESFADALRICVSRQWKRRVNLSEAKDTTSKFRALKALAIKAHDGEREHLFFKGEMRARRVSEDEGWAVRAGNVAYDLCSDFGRSFLRPLAIWAIVLLGVTAVYWDYAIFSQALNTCSRFADFWHALYLSFRNGMVLLGSARDQRVTDAYLCLFGPQTIPSGAPPDPRYPPLAVTSNGIPDIPGWITAMEMAHTLISVILIFLIALAMRNQFKIK